MKKIGFIGAYDKTDLIIYVAKILETLNQKVLVIDATINQKARYVVPVISPTTEYVTEYEDIDIAVGFSNEESIKRYLGLADDQEMEYDMVLVDTDNYKGFEEFQLKDAQKNYFVTSFDVYSLKKGLEIINNLEEPVSLTKILFSKEMLKEEDDYLNFLSLGCKVIWNEYRIYFPIENGDLSVIYENQRVAKVKFKKLSVQYKDGLAYIAEEILGDANETRVRKAIKTIERGV
ncbi:MAG: hypothetical protein EGQ16_02330 [Clostridiales bacterium]|nr:hypothetical protein [Clostridiales bacterium]